MDAFCAYLQARFVQGPLPYLERAIAKDARYSYLYARDVVCGPFSLGEVAIATSPFFSYMYSRDVLRGPFYLGEAAISSCSSRLDYQFRFNRDICSSEQLLRHPSYALSHAIMIGGRFPSGEPAMKKSPRIWIRYKSFLEEIGVHHG